MPDILHILLNGTVRCELSAVGRVKDGCLSPPRLVPVSLIHPLVRLGIGTEVLEDKVGIIKDAVKRYGDFTALKGVNLEIKQGEFFTLLGPSGCGKTTLLRMIAGFNSVDGGEICFDDKVINNLEAHKRDIGMVFQNYAIFPHLTVAENVAYGLKAKKYPKDQIPGKVEEALDLVQIKNLKDRKPNELSGGQQQRVALARALIVEPKLCLLDEPFCNLDAALRTKMRHELKRLQKALGLTMVFVTHDQEEAIILADRIAIMDQGELVQNDAPLELCRRPASPFVAEFMDLESLVWTEDGRMLKIIKR